LGPTFEPSWNGGAIGIGGRLTSVFAEARIAAYAESQAVIVLVGVIDLHGAFALNLCSGVFGLVTLNSAGSGREVAERYASSIVREPMIASAARRNSMPRIRNRPANDPPAWI
jgi:hypothetical protein